MIYITCYLYDHIRADVFHNVNRRYFCPDDVPKSFKTRLPEEKLLGSD